MLNEHEIYVLGKNAVDEIRNTYYQSIGSDVISRSPEKFISNLDTMIAKLERIKKFTSIYKESIKEDLDPENEW